MWYWLYNFHCNLLLWPAVDPDISSVFWWSKKKKQQHCARLSGQWPVYSSLKLNNSTSKLHFNWTSWCEQPLDFVLCVEWWAGDLFVFLSLSQIPCKCFKLCLSPVEQKTVRNSSCQVWQTPKCCFPSSTAMKPSQKIQNWQTTSCFNVHTCVSTSYTALQHLVHSCRLVYISQDWTWF